MGIGWAMVGRAEFAYFIAIMAKSLKMMDDTLFAILIWALIYATIFAPLIFRKVLMRYMGAETGAKPTLAHLGSGHLPDFEAEELAEKARQMHQDYENVKAKLQEKEGELERVHSGIGDLPDLEKAQSPSPPETDSTRDDASFCKMEMTEEASLQHNFRTAHLEAVVASTLTPITIENMTIDHVSRFTTI